MRIYKDNDELITYNLKLLFTGRWNIYNDRINTLEGSKTLEM